MENIPKRGRGRPRKYPISAPEGSNLAPVKRGRGRPRKYPIQTEVAPVGVPVVKRGRGRPRKNPLPTEPVVAKKRGRPRKNPVSEVGVTVPKKRGRPKITKIGSGRTRRKKGGTFDTYVSNKDVDIPEESIVFTHIGNNNIKEIVFKEAKIRIQGESRTYLFSYKDKFIIGVGTLTEDFHNEYTWVVVNRNTWATLDTWTGKCKMMEKIEEYNPKNITNEKHLQMKVEEVY